MLCEGDRQGGRAAYLLDLSRNYYHYLTALSGSVFSGALDAPVTIVMDLSCIKVVLFVDFTAINQKWILLL